MRIGGHSSLEYLARRQFPDYRALTAEDTPPFSRPNADLPSAERSAEFQAWWERHAALPEEELERLVAAERRKEEEEQLAASAVAEKGRFYNRPDAAADFAYWAKMTYWTLDEATALSFGKSPEVVTYKRVEPYARSSINGTRKAPFADEYLQRKELVNRAFAWRKLSDPVAPANFLRWAQRSELSLPEDLVKAIEASGQALVDWQDLHEKTQQENTALTQALDDARSVIESTKRLLKDLTAERDVLIEKLNETSATSKTVQEAASAIARWPWGAYETKHLRSLEAAAMKWWVNVSPADNTTAPTNAQVSKWLQEHHKTSERLADSIATILRADELPAGPRT